MSKKEENNAIPPSLGEISTIRDILMGQQMNEYDSRFQILDNKINSLEVELFKRLEEMENRLSSQFNHFKQEMNTRLDAMEKQASTNSNQLDQKIEKVSQADNLRLGKMLAKVSKQLMGE